ncbi:MAG: zinc-ribbon domain-containing protein [Lachnospiraceae bacterium]
MKCRKCGAELLVTDTFCVNCGHKVEPAFCPSCGEPLREGTKFCHKCGAAVTEDDLEDDAIPLVQQNTVDIPFEQIEQGILFEAAKAANEPPRNLYQKPVIDSEELNGHDGAGDAGEGDDYDEDDYDDEERGSSFVTKLSVIIGIVILFVALAAAFFYWKNNVGLPEKEQEEEQQEITSEDGTPEEPEMECQGRIQVIKNVNVRDNPSTEQSTVLFVAHAGDTFEYYEKDDSGWYHIKIADSEKSYEEGYVYGDYVESLD